MISFAGWRWSLLPGSDYIVVTLPPVLVTREYTETYCVDLTVTSSNASLYPGEMHSLAVFPPTCAQWPRSTALVPVQIVCRHFASARTDVSRNLGTAASSESNSRKSECCDHKGSGGLAERIIIDQPTRSTPERGGLVPQSETFACPTAFARHTRKLANSQYPDRKELYLQ